MDMITKRGMHREIKMWDDIINICVQPISKDSTVPSIEELMKELENTIVIWNELKKMIYERYEHEHSEYSTV